MAAVQQRNGSFRIHFRYHGKQYAFTLGIVPAEEADATARQVEYLLLCISQGLKKLPDDVDIVTYLDLRRRSACTGSNDGTGLS